MLNIQVYKVDHGHAVCYNRNCKRNPDYHWNVIGEVWYIKADTVVAALWTSGGCIEVYCRECIDEILQLCKEKLDSSLWAFQ